MFMSTDYSNIQPQPQMRKGLAIASLVLGIISIPTLGLLGVGAIVAIVLGVIALGRIKKEPAAYGGKGMAIAGIITSVVSLLLIAVFGILAAIAVPKLSENIKTVREVAAASSLATIYEHQMRFKETNSKFATLKELVEAGLLKQPYADGISISGYVYSISDLSDKTFCVHADRARDNAGARDFIVCEDGAVRSKASKTRGTVKRGEGDSAGPFVTLPEATPQQ
jgi:type II secretory pathway pseudopilin PulG